MNLRIAAFLLLRIGLGLLEQICIDIIIGAYADQMPSIGVSQLRCGDSTDNYGACSVQMSDL